ncbi:hypothetical protein RGU75_10915 [Glaciimonas sp. CA11.2]|uniref:hypothetical protein n=1 Tax=Glaciimonas sp. CA11.2 TaxID=3048601 RepID=UPI002AB5A95C|nr:hypothetical protein [Glaciimonas sp. CA11.2]MDY7546740.1 hypothetical protein [Glaciimonas sp. CA11.2]
MSNNYTGCSMALTSRPCTNIRSAPIRGQVEVKQCHFTRVLSVYNRKWPDFEMTYTYTAQHSSMFSVMAPTPLHSSLTTDEFQTLIDQRDAALAECSTVWGECDAVRGELRVTQVERDLLKEQLKALSASIIWCRERSAQRRSMRPVSQ